jgi:hypothetical protein
VALGGWNHGRSAACRLVLSGIVITSIDSQVKSVDNILKSWARSRKYIGSTDREALLAV